MGNNQRRGKFEPNEQQKKAIEHVSGPMLVVAGAGTGKTSVMAARFARLIAGRHARSDEILAVTYTDEATRHLREKILEHLQGLKVGVAPGEVRVSTFHAYCFGLLKRAGREFRVLDQQDHWIFLRRQLQKLPLKHYLPPRDPGEFLDALLEFFSRCQDELVDAERYGAYVDELCFLTDPHRPMAGRCGAPATLPRVLPAKKDAELSAEEKLERCREIAAVFKKAEEMLAAENLGTFGHMISGAVRLLRQDGALLATERARARFILIDEFQDANVAQIELARLLSGEEGNVFAVGDPDQAIYRFRGASSAAFEEFLRRFPGTQAVVLKENQRSTSHVLRCAHAVIRANPGVDCRLAPGVDFTRQPLISARELAAEKRGKPLTPTKVEVVINSAREQEAGDLAKTIRRARNQGYGGSIAVVYRQHAHRLEVMRELANERLPFAVRGLDALERPEVRDLVAALGAVESLSNSEDLFRVSALPRFGLDAAAVRQELAASGRDSSYAVLLTRVPGGARVMAAIEAARTFAAGANWQAVGACDYVIREFGFEARAESIAAFREFVARWAEKPITTTGTLKEFIEYLDLFRAAHGALPLSPPESAEAVQLMTVHAAKGLEFDRVFVVRANSGSFPSNYGEALFEFPQALREMPVPDDGLALHKQEERRLFYVAMTRARDLLSIHAKRGTGKKDPSPPGFVRELLTASDCKRSLTQRDARPYTATLFAGSPASGVAAWLSIPVSPRVAGQSLSATVIEAYATCPLKCKLLLDWRHIPGPVSAALLYGNVMHTVLRDFNQALQAGRPRTEAEVLALFQEEMGKARFDDQFQARLYAEQGARQLSDFVRRHAPRPQPSILKVETEFSVRIAGVPVRGRMDRVDSVNGGGIRIIDYKTGSAFTQEKTDGSLQLTLYAMAARQAWQFEAEELVIYNLEDNSEVVTRRDRAACAGAEQKVAQVAAGIAAGEFPAKEGFHCTWCAYRGLCPMKEQALEMDAGSGRA